MSTDTLARLQNGLETEGQDFANLSTAVLPSGARQRHDNLIAADPTRFVQTGKSPSGADRAERRTEVERRRPPREGRKAVRLVISPHPRDLLDRLLKLRRDSKRPDAAEIKTHQPTWTRRAHLLQGILATRERFRGAVADIVGDRL